MRIVTKGACLVILGILLVTLIACAPDKPVVIETPQNASPPIVRVSESDKPVVIETPLDAAPPVVRISDNNYAAKDMVSLMHLAEDSDLVGLFVPDPQVYIDEAVNQAEQLKLNGENLKEILTKLARHIDQLDFSGKNVGENGVQWTFMLSHKTAQLPYLIERASYQGKKAWLVVLNWEMNTGNLTHGSHVAVIAFEYGTDRVLFAMSCA